MKIAEGEKVVLWYTSGNRDEAVFPDPYAFDITRPNLKEQMGFGAGGPHYCLGANLARREMTVMFDELLHRLPDLADHRAARDPRVGLHPRHQAHAVCVDACLVRGPSGTAVLTAVARALHREEPPPWVLDDSLALGLAGEAGPALRARLLREMAHDDLLGFTRWVCVRARLPEDIVEDAIAAGAGQYVILGAGLDSFAYRRHDLLDHLRVYEIDHPDTQAWKRARLAELDVEEPAALVFASVDFERQTLVEGLTAAGFDFDTPAVFSWIGVTLYLTLTAITTTLDTVDAMPDRYASRAHLQPAERGASRDGRNHRCGPGRHRGDDGRADRQHVRPR